MGFLCQPIAIDEREVVQEMAEGISGLLIGDKGTIHPLTEELKSQPIDLQTPLRKNTR
jgi:hypothetical protein